MALEATTLESAEAIPAKLTDDDRRRLVDEAIERNDRIVESEIDMARLFIASGKIDIARRRLSEVIEKFSGSTAIDQARNLLKELRPARR